MVTKTFINIVQNFFFRETTRKFWQIFFFWVNYHFKIDELY